MSTYTASADGRDRRAIVFRVDSGAHIGSGHVIRCLTLAQVLAGRGRRVEFVCAELPGNLIHRIEQCGFGVRRLASGPVDSTSRSQRQDAAATLAVTTDLAIDWIVLDHYMLSARWEAMVASRTRELMVIEDLDGRAHHCDVLLDQNWYSTELALRYAGRVDAKCRLCLGPRFALLQPEYAQLRALVPSGRDAVRRVLVFFGNSDPTNETGKVLEALAEPQFGSLAVDAVLGSNHPDPSAIRASAAQLPAATLHTEMPTLAGLMLRADLVIGAGGSTTWERLCLGLPALVTTLAPNQEPIARNLDEAGYVRWLGRAGEMQAPDYVRAIQSGGHSLTGRQPLVDGYGVRRVAELLCPSHAGLLAVRRAQPSDAVLFFDWRNDPSVRTMSLQGDVVQWAEHQRWFADRVKSAQVELFVLEADGLPVGQVRLDFGADTGVLSYSLDQLVRGRGWSKRMLHEVIEMARARYRGGLIARVKEENTASRHSFVALGWEECGNAGGIVTYALH